MMKSLITLMFVAVVGEAYARPSLDSYAGVTNDWYQACYSNVYELAQNRLAANSNDLVAAYLMLDWSTAFEYASETAMRMTRVITLSDSITNEPFASVHQRIRPALVEYRDEFLPTLSREAEDAERHKVFQRGRVITSSYMLRLLEQSGLW